MKNRERPRGRREAVFELAIETPPQTERGCLVLAAKKKRSWLLIFSHSDSSTEESSFTLSWCRTYCCGAGMTHNHDRHLGGLSRA